MKVQGKINREKMKRRRRRSTNRTTEDNVKRNWEEMNSGKGEDEGRENKPR